MPYNNLDHCNSAQYSYNNSCNKCCQKGDKGERGDQGERGPIGDRGDQGPRGFQGDKGIKGDTGSQGAQGPQGNAGAQGPQGNAGAQGPQGETGAQGPQGETGAQGPQGGTGAQGPQGNAGVDPVCCFDYLFSEDTSSNPVAAETKGTISANTQILENAEKIWINKMDCECNSIIKFIQLLINNESSIKGHIKLVSKTDSTHFAYYSITSVIDSNANHYILCVTNLSCSQGCPFVNGEKISVCFCITGDKGDQGPQGAPISSAYANIQGPQGVSGSSDIMGLTGTQGTGSVIPIGINIDNINVKINGNDGIYIIIIHVVATIVNGEAMDIKIRINDNPINFGNLTVTNSGTNPSKFTISNSAIVCLNDCDNVTFYNYGNTVTFEDSGFSATIHRIADKPQII